MKRLLTATLTSLCLVPLAQAEVTRVGFATEPYPPFATTDASGELHGWEVDITRAICEAAELECKLVTTSWDGLIPALTGGKIDFIAASLSITDKRRETIAFSDKYYQTPAALAGAKGVELEPTSEGLAGKRSACSPPPSTRPMPGAFPRGDPARVSDQDEANQDLFAGRLDATLADRLIIEQFLESKEGQLCCEMTGDVAHDPQTLGDGIGFGVRQDDDALRERLNEAIAEVRANGTYDEITARYFDFDIYGEPDT
ncbi:lysine-arginine-ornithine-binding periplasmic protein precursor [Halomonas elongata]|uniref:Lysine-arginine-ornithine-binding periplasmic protein n=1 Tax=Halomonas elongata TaxID=2746 RepID=A0A1B8P349_HALEL|nr:transporter substrate-binding domain-containing protein [Halomonas elongata]OBX36681.1 lysine-arginine-ornithine-binding periplasmic protein precursor [Halomonas elongata]